ncbi:MAG: hypothetical protein KF787_10375 [Phycisphaeraceae bacterium]|nr:hypothetical protein [Phycisphaerae bacterium]MBX3393040.1 hypothetical protein [Phycisphaeraceae bacterium]HRJ50874.1 hypothetical protein [Phycisphaerales bacterium]
MGSTSSPRRFLHAWMSFQARGLDRCLPRIGVVCVLFRSRRAFFPTNGSRVLARMVRMSSAR